jgi:asparagine synthase (glutamine-hydrolysing)
VGILLSGGIDSSLVAALASRVSRTPVKTFTMTFPGFGRFDESKHAAQIAKHFGTEHHELEAKPASLSLLPQLAAQFDEPMVDSSMIPTFMVSQMIRQHAKVALGGDGGDELFGGYSTYGRLEFLHTLNKLAAVPKGLKQAVISRVMRHYGQNMRGRNYLAALEAMLHGKLPDVRRLFLREEMTSLLQPEYARHLDETHVATAGRDESDSAAETLIYRLCRADFSGYLVEDILTKVDRASMLTSLEVRAPWLDHRIIEFAFGSVPDSLKTTLRRRKLLPKLLARNLFPADYDFERKQGFSLPLSGWFKQGGAGELGDLIRQNPLPIFRERETEAILKGGVQGPNPEKVFGIALLGLWCRHYHVSF